MPDDSPNRLLKEKLIEIISEAGLQQMQREPTRDHNLLDLLCCNKPSLVKACISIPGISDHSIVLADCDLKATVKHSKFLVWIMFILIFLKTLCEVNTKKREFAIPV